MKATVLVVSLVVVDDKDLSLGDRCGFAISDKLFALLDCLGLFVVLCDRFFVFTHGSDIVVEENLAFLEQIAALKFPLHLRLDEHVVEQVWEGDRQVFAVIDESKLSLELLKKCLINCGVVSLWASPHHDHVRLGVTRREGFSASVLPGRGFLSLFSLLCPSLLGLFCTSFIVRLLLLLIPLIIRRDFVLIFAFVVNPDLGSVLDLLLLFRGQRLYFFSNF